MLPVNVDEYNVIKDLKHEHSSAGLIPTPYLSPEQTRKLETFDTIIHVLCLYVDNHFLFPNLPHASRYRWPSARQNVPNVDGRQLRRNVHDRALIVKDN